MQVQQLVHHIGAIQSKSWRTRVPFCTRQLPAQLQSAPIVLSLRAELRPFMEAFVAELSDTHHTERLGDVRRQKKSIAIERWPALLIASASKWHDACQRAVFYERRGLLQRVHHLEPWDAHGDALHVCFLQLMTPPDLSNRAQDFWDPPAAWGGLLLSSVLQTSFCEDKGYSIMDRRIQLRALWGDLGSPVTVRDIEEDTKEGCRVKAFCMQRKGDQREACSALNWAQRVPCCRTGCSLLFT